jgi:hypothetical protein
MATAIAGVGMTRPDNDVLGIHGDNTDKTIAVHPTKKKKD